MIVVQILLLKNQDRETKYENIVNSLYVGHGNIFIKDA